MSILVFFVKDSDDSPFCGQNDATSLLTQDPNDQKGRLDRFGQEEVGPTCLRIRDEMGTRQ